MNAGGGVIALGTAVASASFSATAQAFLWAIAGIILGGAFTYLAARIQVRHSYRSNERERLLQHRTESFQRLWKLTGRLPRNPDPNELSCFSAHEIVQELSDWYFGDGGMYLTNACRTDYFNLLEKLEGHERHKPLNREEYLPLYTAASQLRHALAKELDARTSTQGTKI